MSKTKVKKVVLLILFGLILVFIFLSKQCLSIRANIFIGQKDFEKIYDASYLNNNSGILEYTLAVVSFKCKYKNIEKAKSFRILNWKYIFDFLTSGDSKSFEDLIFKIKNGHLSLSEEHSVRFFNIPHYNFVFVNSNNVVLTNKIPTVVTFFSKSNFQYLINVSRFEGSGVVRYRCYLLNYTNIVTNFDYGSSPSDSMGLSFIKKKKLGASNLYCYSLTSYEFLKNAKYRLIETENEEVSFSDSSIIPVFKVRTNKLIEYSSAEDSSLHCVTNLGNDLK